MWLAILKIPPEAGCGSTQVSRSFSLGPNVVIVDTCMCTFGARWRKPTRLMFWNCSPSDQFRMCKNASGLCDFTHRKHVVLSGAEKGVFRTSHAQVYPVKFAQALAESLLSPPPGP